VATYDELIAAANAAKQEGRDDAAQILAARAVEMRVSEQAEEAVVESTRSQASDIARGVGAGLVGVGQGIAELGALGLDAALDTDYSRATTDFFVGAKEGLGLDPETTAGKAAEAISNFGFAFIPVAGWLGRAGRAAQGAKTVGQSGAFGRSADAFGRSATGRQLVGSRARLAATTSLAAGVSDFFVSPDGMGTLADAFDALPEGLQTEEDTGLTGQDEAFRRLRNKIRVGAEGTAFGAAFETLFPAARLATSVVAQIPGVPQAARLAVQGIERAGEALSRIPGAQRFLTAAGDTPSQAFLDIEGTRAFVDSQTLTAQNLLQELDKAARAATPKFLGAITGKGRAGLDQTYDAVYQYLNGNNRALDNFDPAVRDAAEKMRTHISGLSEVVADQVSGSALSRPEKQQILDVFKANSDGYIRRLFRRFEDPNFLVDEKTFTSQNYIQAVRETQDNMQRMGLPATREAAEQFVQKQLGRDFLDVGINPAEGARIAAKNVKRGREEIQRAGMPLNRVAEGLLVPRKELVDKSPALRELLGEIKDPKLAYLRTVGDMAQLVGSNRLYSNMAGDFAADAAQTVARVNAGEAAPLIIRGPGSDAVGQQLGYKQLGQELPIGAKIEEGQSVFGGTFGELSGAWVSPEMYSALTMPSRMTQGVLNEALALSLQAKGASQAAKTVYSPISQVRNFMSGVFLTLANGNLMRGMPFSDSFRLTANKAANLSDPEFKRLHELMGNLGLRDQNISVNEYRNLLQEGSDLTVAGTTAGGIRTALDKIPFASALQKTYAGTDTFWKIVNFNAERAKYANALRSAGVSLDGINAPLSQVERNVQNLLRQNQSLEVANRLSVDDIARQLNISPEAVDVASRKIGLMDDLVRSGLNSRTSEITGTAGFLDTLAGDIVKNTQPTYSRVPEGIKMLRRIPVVGNFVAFPAEVIRNTANIVDRGLREMSFAASPELVQRLGQDGARRLEREIRAIGAQRVSGYMASAIAIPTGIQAASKELLGWDDQQMSDLERLAPYYMDGHTLVPLSRAGDPNIEFIDLSYMMPYDFAVAPARAALQIYGQQRSVGASQAEQIRQGLFAGLGKLMEPFASESLIGERVLNVTTRNGVTPTGQEIFDENTPFAEKMGRATTHVLSGFSPGAADLFVQERAGQLRAGRIPRAITGTPSATGQPYDTFEEGAALVSGLRPMTIRLPETFRYKGFEYNQARQDAANVFGRAANANDTTADDVLSAFRQANERALRAQAQMYDLVQSAKRLGLSDQDIRRELVRRANLTQRDVSSIMRGRFNPISLSDDRIRSVLEEGRRENRVLRRLPVQEIRAIEREFRNMPLPSARFEESLDAERPRAAPTAAPAQVPVAQRAAPAAPVVAPAPARAVPQTPQAPARTAPPSPSLLGPDPISPARNAEIAQRLSNQ
jgi:hypothetical protein